MAIRQAVIINSTECKFLIDAVVYYLKNNSKNISYLEKEEIYLLLKTMGASDEIIRRCRL